MFNYFVVCVIKLHDREDVILVHMLYKDFVWTQNVLMYNFFSRISFLF